MASRSEARGRPEGRSKRRRCSGVAALDREVPVRRLAVLAVPSVDEDGAVVEVTEHRVPVLRSLARLAGLRSLPAPEFEIRVSLLDGAVVNVISSYPSTYCRSTTARRGAFMSVEAWTAWGVWGQALAVVVAGIVAVRQLRATSSARKEQARAHVVVYFDFPEDRRQFPDLVVVNLGQSAATDVRFEFTPQLRSSTNDEIHEVGMFAAGIATLVPGQRLSTLFDTLLERPKEWENAYSVVVTYKDTFGDSHEDTFSVDLGPHRKTHWIDRKGIHDIHRRLEGIEKELKHLRSGFGGPMPVVTEDRTTYVERTSAQDEERRRIWEEREARRAEQLREADSVDGDGADSAIEE